MDLKFILFFIFCFLFCFTRSQCTNLLECQVGDVIEDPTVRRDCYPPSEVRKAPKEKCKFFTCKHNETMDWSITNPKKGELQIQVRSLPKFCDFERFDFDLEVYESEEPFNEALMCDTGMAPWRMHSRRTVENSLCSNCTLNYLENCTEMVTVIYRYVFPGYYRIKVTPFAKEGSRQAQRSYLLNINSTITNYEKKKITDLSLNASLQYRIAKRELDLGIPLLLEDAPDSVRLDVKFSDNGLRLYGINYGNDNSSNVTCEGSGDILPPACTSHGGGLVCKFFNMSQGHYNIYVQFTDDRCRRGSIWANPNADPCYWVIRKNVSGPGSHSETISPPSDSSSSHFVYTVVLIVILVSVIIISYLVKKRHWRKGRLRNGIIGKACGTSRKSSSEQTYNFSSESPRINFAQLLALSEKPKPEVLLIYTRDSGPFMDLVVCLRKILDKVFKCQVYDYYNPELWNEISEDPKGWINALIAERQTKIIIVASEVAAIRHRALLGETPSHSYKSPHPFDHLFLYALRLLRDKMDEESYKNHFIVTFDGYTENNHLLEHFNPYTRFVIPKHLNRLFGHLHELDTTMELENNVVEERDEIRQLRLQLERAKNLKLIGRTDAFAQKH